MVVFSCYLNCANGTKLPNASHLVMMALIPLPPTNTHTHTHTHTQLIHFFKRVEVELKNTN